MCNTHRVIWLTAMVVFAATCASAVNAAEPGGDGFTDLLADKDLSRFKTTGNWSLGDDGVVSLAPRPGEHGWKRYGAYLWVDKTYTDFVFDLEYKIPKGGNSGVFVKVKDPAEPVRSGIEVQILDSHGKAKLGPHDCGGVIGIVGAGKNASKPAGEWNRMIVTCRGSQLTVEFNGQQIIDLDLAKASKKDLAGPGYVGVQDHGQPIEFRNLRIKKL